MKLGFTGTRRGMTSKQQQDFLNFLMDRKVTELHHGDCLGADDEADKIAKELGIRIVVHPPVNMKDRAFCFGRGSGSGRSTFENQETRAPKPYLDRNHDIVDETDELFAAPFQQDEVLRSGTWATIRYARKQNKSVHVSIRDKS